VELKAAGQRWVLDKRVIPLLDLLASGKPATLGLLAETAGITTDQAIDLIGQLLAAGVVAVRPT
jgi:hypothetical protein